MISGLKWVSELIETAGGVEVFPALSTNKNAKDRIVTANDVIAAAPDINHRLVVRQEVRAGESRGASGVRRNSGGPRRRAARNQVGADPAAGPRRADRRLDQLVRIVGDWVSRVSNPAR